MAPRLDGELAGGGEVPGGEDTLRGDGPGVGGPGVAGVVPLEGEGVVGGGSVHVHGLAGDQVQGGQGGPGGGVGQPDGVGGVVDGDPGGPGHPAALGGDGVHPGLLGGGENAGGGDRPLRGGPGHGAGEGGHGLPASVQGHRAALGRAPAQKHQVPGGDVEGPGLARGLEVGHQEDGVAYGPGRTLRGPVHGGGGGLVGVGGDKGGGAAPVQEHPFHAAQLRQPLGHQPGGGPGAVA